MRGKHFLSGSTVYRLSGPTLSINYGFAGASESGLRGKKKGCHDKEEKWDSERCPSGAVATDGREGGLTALLRLQVAGDHGVCAGPTPHSHLHETRFAEIPGN